MDSFELIPITTRLADSECRGEALKELAHRLGISELLIFVIDPALGVLLPAPGFPQTLPEGKRWIDFAKHCVETGNNSASLPAPTSGRSEKVFARRSIDGSVIALVGGSPNLNVFDSFLKLVPLLVTSLKAERAVLTSQGQAQAIRASAIRAHQQAIALDQARVELEHTLHELEESQARFRFAMNAAKMGDWDFNFKTNTTKRSTAQARCFGYQEVPSSWNFDIFLSHVLPEDRTHVREAWTNAIVGKSDYSVEYRVQWPDGTIHWLSSKGRLLRNVKGEAEHFVGVVVDITQQKEMEQSLRKAINLRDEFLSIASHELRTPITGMKLQTQMMKRGIERGDPNVFSQPRVTKLVQQVDHSLDRLGRLIEDMLDISRIQLGKLSIHREEFDLAITVRDTVDRFRSQLAAAGIPTSVVTDPECRIIGDRFRFEQVVTNFITNVTRYAPGGPLKVIVRQDQNDACVEFQDSGPGIAKENQNRIFERFERLISADEVSGMGLGLYIVKQIIEAHQGSIQVESELGKGAKFILRIPRRPTQETQL